MATLSGNASQVPFLLKDLLLRRELTDLLGSQFVSDYTIWGADLGLGKIQHVVCLFVWAGCCAEDIHGSAGRDEPPQCDVARILEGNRVPQVLLHVLAVSC